MYSPSSKHSKISFVDLALPIRYKKIYFFLCFNNCSGRTASIHAIGYFFSTKSESETKSNPLSGTVKEIFRRTCCFLDGKIHFGSAIKIFKYFLQFHVEFTEIMLGKVEVEPSLSPIFNFSVAKKNAGKHKIPALKACSYLNPPNLRFFELFT